MKNLKFLLLGGAAFLCAATFSSCSEDNDYDSTETISPADGNFVYDADNVWTLNNTSGDFKIDDYEFSHSVIDGFVYGFTPSKVSDTSLHDPLYTFPYASANGGGVNGSSAPYFVGYWGEFLEGTDCEFENRTVRIWEEEGETFKPQSMMVCCNTYLYYAVTRGTDFSAPFASGDWVTLTAHGVHLDGTTSEATIYLVNISGDDLDGGVVKEWTKFDLSGLGVCTGVYFTMDSSDKGEWGINIPTYFCMSNFVVKD